MREGTQTFKLGLSPDIQLSPNEAAAVTFVCVFEIIFSVSVEAGDDSDSRIDFKVASERRGKIVLRQSGVTFDAGRQKQPTCNCSIVSSAPLSSAANLFYAKLFASR